MTEQLEGNGAQRLLRLFGRKSEGISVTLATIVTPPPKISIRIDGDTIDTPSEGIILAEHLAEHTRTVSYADGTVSGSVDGFHGAGTLKSLKVTDGKLTFKSDLKKDDQVIVVIANEGQLVYVLDKAVM